MPRTVPSIVLRAALQAWTLAALALGSSPAAQAPAAKTGTDDDWPRWRGPHFDDSARGGGVLDGAFGLQVRWRRAIGSGYSGVSVLGARAVTLAATAGEDDVLAFDAESGAELWRRRIGTAFSGQDGACDGPVSTPTLADDAVYALDPHGALFALALADGAVRWTVDLAGTYGAPEPHWGFTTAPLCVGELVIVAAGAPGGHAFMAFAKQDGALRWSAGADTIHYQSPLLARVGGRELVVGAGNLYLFGLEPASGAEAWRLAHGGSDFYQEILQPLALEDDGFLLKSARAGARRVRIAPGATGAALEEQWSSRHLRQNYNQTVLHDGLLFGHGGSLLSCVDAGSGELLWRSRAPGDGWVICVDGQLVVLTKAGTLHVAPASPDGYEERAALELFEHLTWTPPSFAHGRIYARDSARDVACVEVVKLTAARAPRANEYGPAASTALFDELAHRVAAADDPAEVVDEFVAAHPRSPVLEGQHTAHFFYRGPAEDMAMRGDMLPDEVDEAMTRIPGTDLFHRSFELAPDARLGYQFVRNFEEVLTDPLNPRTGPSLTLGGPVSEICMPAAAPAPELAPPDAGVRAACESFVLDVPVRVRAGRSWGGQRRAWVHLPQGYAGSSARYPVLYVNDDTTALDRLRLPALLDRLAGVTMQPVIAVFVQQQGAYEFARAEQDLYRDLCADVLVPYVDAHYRTLARADARAVLGWDEGAYAALFAALSRPRCFGAVGAQSLYHGSNQGQGVLEALIDGAQELPHVELDWGRSDARQPARGLDTPAASRALLARLTQRAARASGVECADGDQCSFWSARLPRLLAALFPRAE